MRYVILVAAIVGLLTGGLGCGMSQDQMAVSIQGAKATVEAMQQLGVDGTVRVRLRPNGRVGLAELFIIENDSEVDAEITVEPMQPEQPDQSG